MEYIQHLVPGLYQNRCPLCKEEWFERRPTSSKYSTFYLPTLIPLERNYF